jgi:hypothetical protein
MGKFSPTKLNGDCEEIANPSTAYGRRQRNWIEAHSPLPARHVVESKTSTASSNCALPRTCPEVLRRVIRIQTVTLLWMSVEAAAAKQMIAEGTLFFIQAIVMQIEYNAEAFKSR